MAPKIFITGTTGYIGGDFLCLVSEKHPEWEITCLVRNTDKGAKVAAVYPSVRLVYGGLDAVEVIEDEAAQTDIVYHFANADHEPSARAIARGLTRRVADRPGFWIHTSGGMNMAYETIAKSEYGNCLPKVYNDWDGVHELTSLPDEAAHRDIDKMVLATGSDHVKTAIVCPPTIYGPGRGPDGRKSMQVYHATELFLQTQQAFQVGKGQNIWHQIHVQDLSDLYLLLGEAAVAGGPPATWNDQGYYLAENGSFVWGDILHAVAEIAAKKGLLPRPDLQDFTADEANNLRRFLAYSVGTNSRGVSLRGKRLLGWTPRQKSLMKELPEVVELEARRLGLIKGHAEKVQ